MSSGSDSTYQNDLVVVALLENFELLVDEKVHGPRVGWLALASVGVLSVVVAAARRVRAWQETYL